MNTNKNSVIDEMLVALRANIEFLNSHGSSKTYIKNGVFLKQIDGQFLYEFELEFFQQIDQDADIEVRVGPLNSQGRIYSLDEVVKKIQVFLDTFLGPNVAQGSLIITNDFLLKKLCERLESVKNDSASFGQLAQCILEPESFNHGSLQLSYADFPEYKLNVGQLAAINLSLGSSTSYIWGPPGTGKTTTIAPLAAKLIADKKSVLLISHTNVATDRALKQYIDKAHINFSEPPNMGKYLRLGTISNELREFKEHIDVDSVAEKKMRPLSLEVDRLEQEMKTNELQITKLETDISLVKELDELKETLTQAKQSIVSTKNLLAEYKQEVNQAQSNLEWVAHEIYDYQQANFFSKMLKGTSLESLMDKKSSYLVSLENNTNAATDAEKNLGKSIKYAIELNKRLAAVEQVSGDIDISDTENQIKQIKKANSRIQDQLKILREKLEKIRSLVITEAQLIATTLSRSYLDKHVLERRYDCVILDEASMAPIPALYYAAGLAKERVVIVGDFCQLPPIAQYNVLENSSKTREMLKVEEEMVNKWLRHDIFNYSKTTSAITTGMEVPWMCQLNEQYRMHPQIMDVINHLIYSNYDQKYWLTAGDNTTRKGCDRLSSEPLPNSRVGIVVPDKQHSFPNHTSSGSYYNIYTATIAIALAKKCVESGNTRIGIITPFRPQADLIKRMVADAKLSENVYADTVHRFQGEEKDVIIFDTVTSKPTKLTDDQEAGGDDEKLLNVALSRAESKIILIADVEGIKKKHSSTSLFLKFVEYCETNKYSVVNSTRYVTGIESDQAEEKWLEQIYKLDNMSDEIKNGLLADQVTFYKFFMKDLLGADKEVIIDSPFITKHRAEQFIPIFNVLLSRGVKIFIISRLPKDQQDFMQYESSSVLAEFEKMGIIVLPFKGLPHRKLAMIDREVFWNGSLNILSQRESQEMMIRTVGKDTCDMVLKFLRFDKNVGKDSGENHLEHCDYCDETGSWFWTDIGQFGPWTFCLTNGHKKGKPPITQAERQQKKEILREKRAQVKKISADGIPICPDHNVELIKKHGRFGDFWGCPHYPRCKVTAK